MRHLPPLNALRAFEAAARHQSFARAAAELGVTPTAISHQIRLLESVAGQPLFRRRPRPVTLTEAGGRLFPVLRDGLDRFAAAIRDLRATPEARPLIIATTSTFAARWLIPRLSALRTVLDGIEVEIEASETVLDLHEASVDFAIRYARSPAPDLEWRLLFRDRYIPVCSRAVLKAGPRIRTPADLAARPLIHFRWKRRDPDAPSWRRWFAQSREGDPRIDMAAAERGLKLSEEAHAFEAALGGQGIALLSDVLVARELADGRLVCPIDHAIEGLGFFVVHLPDAPRRRLIDRFVAWARAEHAASD